MTEKAARWRCRVCRKALPQLHRGRMRENAGRGKLPGGRPRLTLSEGWDDRGPVATERVDAHRAEGVTWGLVGEASKPQDTHRPAQAVGSQLLGLAGMGRDSDVPTRCNPEKAVVGQFSEGQSLVLQPFPKPTQFLEHFLDVAGGGRVDFYPRDPFVTRGVDPDCIIPARCVGTNVLECAVQIHTTTEAPALRGPDVIFVSGSEGLESRAVVRLQGWD